MIALPTFTELYNGILSDLEAEFTFTIPFFGKNFLRAFAGVQAGKLWLYYKAIGGLQKNIFIDTADPSSTGGTLERFGMVKLGRLPFPAVAGQYTVQVTGTIGQVLNASITFKSDDNSKSPGILFILDNTFVLDGVDIITLRSLTPGLEARLSIGDTLTVTSPIALVDSKVTVLTESVQPEAAETIEDYRRKGLDAYRLEPQGGAGADYRIWSSDAQGVEQSYPFTASGFDDTINLFIEATIADSTDGFGTPSMTILNAVQSAIEDPTADRPARKPLGAVVNYLPITPRQIDITIASFTGITTDIETAITNTITEYLATVRPFVGSIDILANKNDIFDINKIISLVLIANVGSFFGAVQMTIDSISYSTFTFDNGNIPHLNSITYV